MFYNPEPTPRAQCLHPPTTIPRSWCHECPSHFMAAEGSLPSPTKGRFHARRPSPPRRGSLVGWRKDPKLPNKRQGLCLDKTPGQALHLRCLNFAEDLVSLTQRGTREDPPQIQKAAALRQ